MKNQKELLEKLLDHLICKAEDEESGQISKWDEEKEPIDEDEDDEETFDSEDSGEGDDDEDDEDSKKVKRLWAALKE